MAPVEKSLNNGSFYDLKDVFSGSLNSFSFESGKTLQPICEDFEFREGRG